MYNLTPSRSYLFIQKNNNHNNNHNNNTNHTFVMFFFAFVLDESIKKGDRTENSLVTILPLINSNYSNLKLAKIVLKGKKN